MTTTTKLILAHLLFGFEMHLLLVWLKTVVDKRYLKYSSRLDTPYHKIYKGRTVFVGYLWINMFLGFFLLWSLPSAIHKYFNYLYKFRYDVDEIKVVDKNKGHVKYLRIIPKSKIFSYDGYSWYDYDRVRAFAKVYLNDEDEAKRLVSLVELHS